MNDAHSELFQNHEGTCNWFSLPSASTLNTLPLNFVVGPKARAYSPLGSRMINLAFGFICDSNADSSDHWINPDTEQDLPLPVFPSTAI